MSNGNKIGRVNDHQQFLEEMLDETLQSLAFARSVREAKFLQSKITYLKVQLDKVGKFNIRRKAV